MGEERVVKAGRLRPLTSVVTVVSKVVSSVLQRNEGSRYYLQTFVASGLDSGQTDVEIN